MITRRQIAKAIKQKTGLDVQLFSADGYHSFFSDDNETMSMLMMLPQTGVYVYRLNDLSLSQWVDSFEALLRG